MQTFLLLHAKCEKWTNRNLHQSSNRQADPSNVVYSAVSIIPVKFPNLSMTLLFMNEILITLLWNCNPLHKDKCIFLLCLYLVDLLLSSQISAQTLPIQFAVSGHRATCNNWSNLWCCLSTSLIHLGLDWLVDVEGSIDVWMKSLGLSVIFSI